MDKTDKDLEMEREVAEATKSRIDSAKDSLYQPGAPKVIPRHPDGGFEERKRDVDDPAEVWPPPVPQEFISPEKKEKVTEKLNIVFRRILYAAIIFFVLALGFAGFMYFYGNNIISARNINIEITAPPSVPSSDTFSFDISVQNGNNSDLIKTAIVIDYPEGARYKEDNTKPLVSERIEIGTLAKGQGIKKTVSARLFGEENALKQIKIRFEYQVNNSNAHFSKDEEFGVILRLAPVVLSIEALQEVNTNQEVVLVARVISNSNNTLSNVALNVMYPYGFTYSRSNLEVEYGNRGEFPLGELLPNETKTVEIYGTINGQSFEDKVFKFNVETGDTSLAMYNHEMTIRGDFLASSITFGSNNKPYTTLDIPLRGNISFKNTLDVPVNDAEFKLKITGDLIDTEEVTAQSGFYDSNTSIIEWNKSTDEDLEEIEPGETGNFAFTVPLFSYEDAIAKKMVNPKVNFTFDIKAQRVNEKNVTENIRSSFTRVVPIVTTVDLEAYSLYSQGPLKNSGPVPPKAESKTTYTVALTISNSLNALSGAELTAKLPSYVKYEGEISPGIDKVSWNDTTRLLRWNPGIIPARTGYSSTPRTLYFKVSVTPSRTQLGQVIRLVEDIAFTGKDTFAGADINETTQNVTTATKEGGNGFGNGQVTE